MKRNVSLNLFSSPQLKSNKASLLLPFVLAITLLLPTSGAAMADKTLNIDDGSISLRVSADDTQYRQDRNWSSYDGELTITGGTSASPSARACRHALAPIIQVAFVNVLLRTIATAKRNHFEPDGSYLKACAYKHEAAGAGTALMFVNDFIRSI